MSKSTTTRNVLTITDGLDNKLSTVEELLDYNDLKNSFKVNWQLNSNYEISFTATYTDQFRDAFNLLAMKRYLWFNDQMYSIQQSEYAFDENGLPTVQVTANAALIDRMKNLRIDPSEPTEDHPEMSGGDSDNSGDNQQQDPQPGTVTIKKTDEQQTFTLKDRLDQFFKNNDQGISYELHGNFPQAAVECSGSLFEWLGSNLATFGAYYVPDNMVLKIYDLPSLRNQTDMVFRYMSNASTVNIQSGGNDMVNDCEVYGGKMEKDITSGGGSGGGGDLDSVEGFCKSPINADFGVNKQAMLSNFAARSNRVQAWGVDVNRLYDVIKQNGVSPEWFFAYELQEQGTGYGWLNHTYRHGDAYQDAASVCDWIKQTAQTPTITAATESGKGNQSLAAKWNQEFPKGTIGHVYLQGTAAAAWELEGIAGGYYGKPLSGCVAVIKSWGGHTVHNDGAGGGGWAWPFACGEGSFMSDQLFGVHPGNGRPNNFHDGLDFGSIDHPGAEVHAIHGGKVTQIAYGAGVDWYCVVTDSTGLNVEYQEAFSNPGLFRVQVGQTIKTGDVIGIRDGTHVHIGITRMAIPAAFAHWASNDGTWLDPQQMIKTGGNASPGGDSGGSSNVTTTTQTYYSLHYHYHNEESVKRYGIHKGAPIVMDSIYDMNALKQYVENTVQHDPPTTISNNQFGERNFKLGDVARLIVPDKDINFDVTLMGVEYNPYNPDGDDATLTWNNTGLTMKNSIYALYQSIKQINRNVDRIDTYGGTGGRAETHVDNVDTNKPQNDDSDSSMKFSQNELEAIKQFTNS